MLQSTVKPDAINDPLQTALEHAKQCREALRTAHAEATLAGRAQLLPLIRAQTTLYTHIAAQCAINTTTTEGVAQ